MDMGWHDKLRYNMIFDVGPQTSNTRILNILIRWYTIGKLRISFHLNHTVSLPFGDNDAPQWTTGFCRPCDVPCEENLANFNRTNNTWRFHGPPPMKEKSPTWTWFFCSLRPERRLLFGVGVLGPLFGSHICNSIRKLTVNSLQFTYLTYIPNHPKPV